MRRLVWPILLAVTACASHRPAIPVGTAADVTPPAACRVGPDGAPPVADRGIGGTGKPAAPAALQTEVETADRGIGGTGIIGVVTGFASVCVAGEEVALSAGVPVRIDDHAGAIEDLRAGQVTALTAQPDAGRLRARAVEVMHVVVGPVEPATGTAMVVAGQRVDPAGATGSAIGAKPGQWVAVSGLRQPGGLIAATRIDPAKPGQAMVRGELVRAYGTARIGSLAIRLPDNSSLPGGWSAVVTGQLQSGVLVADTARLDIAGESPSAYFGPAVSSFVIETYATVVEGGYLVDRDFVAGTPFGVIGSHGRRIVIFGRSADGRLSSAGQAPASNPETPGYDFRPAPLPGGSSPANGDRDDNSQSRSRPGAGDAPYLNGGPPGAPPHR